jgi:hypothetical protein
MVNVSLLGESVRSASRDSHWPRNARWACRQVPRHDRALGVMSNWTPIASFATKNGGIAGTVDRAGKRDLSDVALHEKLPPESLGTHATLS